MEKSRKNKMLAIIALVFAIAALTLGFASFSKIMKISSSATASLPSEENFNVELYGITSSKDIEDLQDNPIDFSKFSKEKAYATDLNYSEFYSDYYANIDNENLIINIENVVLTEPGEGYMYYFVLRNNSDYGVYVYVSDEIKEIYSSGLRGTCTAEEGTSQILVDNACRDMRLTIADSNLFKGTYKLAANDVMIIPIFVSYDSTTNRADGEFLVNFPQIKIEFDTIAHTYNNLNVVSEDA